MMLGERYGGPKGACARREVVWARRRTTVVVERSALAVASAVCQCYDRVLPLAVGEWEEWRFAATSDVLTLRFVVRVVKLRRRARAIVLILRCARTSASR